MSKDSVALAKIDKSLLTLSSAAAVASALSN
jgi:hypothetical protein